MKENMLTSKEAAEYLGLKEFTLRKWRCEKHGPSYYKVGGKVYYNLQEIDFWISTNRIKI